MEYRISQDRFEQLRSQRNWRLGIEDAVLPQHGSGHHVDVVCTIGGEVHRLAGSITSGQDPDKTRGYILIESR